MTFRLIPQLEREARQKIVSATCTSAGEVPREALRLMDEPDRLRATRLAQVRQKIRAGKQSGPPAARASQQVKREGRARKATRAKA